jgi:hypothetical protein
MGVGSRSSSAVSITTCAAYSRGPRRHEIRAHLINVAPSLSSNRAVRTSMSSSSRDLLAHSRMHCGVRALMDSSVPGVEARNFRKLPTAPHRSAHLSGTGLSESSQASQSLIVVQAHGILPQIAGDNTRQSMRLLNMRRRRWRPSLMKRSNRKKSSRTDRPTLPELDQTKRSVLNSLTSLQSRRSYQHAMDEFIEWYCSEPRLALNRGVVLR